MPLIATTSDSPTAGRVDTGTAAMVWWMEPRGPLLAARETVLDPVGAVAGEELADPGCPDEVDATAEPFVPPFAADEVLAPPPVQPARTALAMHAAATPQMRTGCSAEPTLTLDSPESIPPIRRCNAQRPNKSLTAAGGWGQCERPASAGFSRDRLPGQYALRPDLVPTLAHPPYSMRAQRNQMRQFMSQESHTRSLPARRPGDAPGPPAAPGAPAGSGSVGRAAEATEATVAAISAR